MIIRYPTAFYRDVLPADLSDSGNVTYVISNTEPPRSVLEFFQLPFGLAQIKRPTPDLSRRQLGGLIFTVTKNSQSNLNNSVKQFELGEILEFESEDLISVEPMLVAEQVEIRHDTNLFSYDLMGLTDEDRDLLVASSEQIIEQLKSELNQLKTQRSDIDAELSKNQKVINETTKTLKSAKIMQELGAQDLTPVIEKLEQNLIMLQDDQEQLVFSANELAGQATVVADKLRSVAQLVR